MGTPAELLFDVPREDVAELVSRAGILRSHDAQVGPYRGRAGG